MPVSPRQPKYAWNCSSAPFTCRTVMKVHLWHGRALAWANSDPALLGEGFSCGRVSSIHGLLNKSSPSPQSTTEYVWKPICAIFLIPLACFVLSSLQFLFPTSGSPYLDDLFRCIAPTLKWAFFFRIDVYTTPGAGTCSFRWEMLLPLTLTHSRQCMESSQCQSLDSNTLRGF